MRETSYMWEFVKYVALCYVLINILYPKLE